MNANSLLWAGRPLRSIALSLEQCPCLRVAEVRYRGCIPERMEAVVNLNSKKGRL